MVFETDLSYGSGLEGSTIIGDRLRVTYRFRKHMVNCHNSPNDPTELLMEQTSLIEEGSYSVQ
jgi:hypothetical protein